MDYTKMNAWNKKDHFPMPFIDQILDHLTSKNGVVFMMVIQGTIDITKIIPQRKVLSSCCQIQNSSKIGVDHIGNRSL